MANAEGYEVVTREFTDEELRVKALEFSTRVSHDTTHLSVGLYTNNPYIKPVNELIVDADKIFNYIKGGMGVLIELEELKKNS